MLPRGIFRRRDRKSVTNPIDHAQNVMPPLSLSSSNVTRKSVIQQTESRDLAHYLAYYDENIYMLLRSPFFIRVSTRRDQMRYAAPSTPIPLRQSENQNRTANKIPIVHSCVVYPRQPWPAPHELRSARDKAGAR